MYSNVQQFNNQVAARARKVAAEERGRAVRHRALVRASLRGRHACPVSVSTKAGARFCFATVGTRVRVVRC